MLFNFLFLFFLHRVLYPNIMINPCDHVLIHIMHGSRIPNNMFNLCNHVLVHWTKTNWFKPLLRKNITILIQGIAHDKASLDPYSLGCPTSGLNTVSSRRCFFLFTIMILAYSIGSCTLWNDWNYFRYFWPTLGMDKGKCGYVGCISGWFWALRVPPGVTDGWVRVSGYWLGRRIWKKRF